MSKYIIDTETWANLFEVQRVGVYGIGNDIVTDEKTVWSRMFSLDELEELNSDYINEHFDSLQDEAYQRGFEDGKKAVSDPDRIEVGDIVERYIDGKLDSKGIYLQEDDGYWRCLFDTNGVLMTFAYPKGQFKKTGKHYDIASILEAMRTHD